MRMRKRQRPSLPLSLIGGPIVFRLPSSDLDDRHGDQNEVPIVQGEMFRNLLHYFDATRLWS